MIENQISENEGEILLYGNIGLGVISGENVARQIDAFNAEGKEQITIRVNSYGGSVSEGLMILSAMLRSKAQITVMIDGVAASIAGVIALAADYTLMADFGLFMIHPASSLSEDADQDKLDKFTDAIKVIFMKRLNKSADEISAFFGDTDRWFSATEALEHGLINQVIATEARDLVEQAQEILNRTHTEIMNEEEVYNLYSKTTSKESMNEEQTITNEVTETEAEVINAAVNPEVVNLTAELTSKTEEVVNLSNEIVNLKKDLEGKATEVLNLTAKVTAFEAKEAEARHNEITEVINAAIEQGKLKATAKDAFIKLAQTDLASVKDVLNAIAAPVKLSSLIQVDEKPFVAKSIDEQIREAREKAK